MLFLIEAHYDLELLKQQFLDLFDRETDEKAISLFLNWFYQLVRYGRQGIKDYKELEKIYKNKEEVREVLIYAIERERR